MKNSLALLCLVFLSADIGSSVASAGMVLSFTPSSPAPLLAGSSGTIDVLIHSNASDFLDSFQVDITLTPIGLSPVGGLKFSTSQSDAQLTDTNYVFPGNSLSYNLTQPVGGVNAAGNLFAGYDATFNYVPVMLTGADQLLFRLNLDGLTAGIYAIGISSATFLTDQTADPLEATYLDRVINFSSTDGTITVAGAAAVPEPSSAIILGMACAFGVFLRRISWKKTATKKHAGEQGGGELL